MPDTRKKTGKKGQAVPVGEVNGIQVNHCKNPGCRNFGIAYTGKADPNYKRAGTTKAATPYGVSPSNLGAGQHISIGRQTSSVLLIHCLSCGEYPPLKSNHGINEVLKLWSYHPDNSSCPNSSCKNHNVPIGTRRAYKKNGKTNSGTVRWQCNQCSGTFVERAKVRPSREHEQPYRREDVIKALVNSVPFNRMREMYNINGTSIYRHIDKAYEACVRFNAIRNRRLPKLLSERKTVYLSTDRQDILVNWRDRHDRNAIPIKAVCTADTETGFVYRYDIGIDERSNAEQIHEESINHGDVDVSPVFRQYPHLFLPSDMSMERRINGYIEQERLKLIKSNPLITEVELAYADAQLRPDVDLPSFHLTHGTGLPDDCLLIREDYQLYAHYIALSYSIPDDVEVINFSDQESGLRSAFMSAFKDKVKNKLAHLFYIRYQKGAVREEREAAETRTQNRIKQVMDLHGCGRYEAKHRLCLNALDKCTRPIGKWNDLWAEHPLESMTEVRKAFSHQTYHPGQNNQKIAHHLIRASLHSVDNLFMRARRRVSQFERGVPTASSDRRIWYGRSFYRPDMVKKTALILTTYLNYCKTDTVKTPAERLGMETVKNSV